MHVANFEFWIFIWILLNLFVLLYVTCVCHFFQYTAACVHNVSHRSHLKNLKGGGGRWWQENLQAGGDGDSE